MFADGIEVYEEAYLGQETEGGGGRARIGCISLKICAFL